MFSSTHHLTLDTLFARKDPSSIAHLPSRVTSSASLAATSGVELVNKIHHRENIYAHDAEQNHVECLPEDGIRHFVIEDTFIKLSFLKIELVSPLICPFARLLIIMIFDRLTPSVNKKDS